MEIRAHLADMQRRRLSPGSIQKRSSVLRRCETHIGRPLLAANADDLLTWLDSRPITPRTLYSDISHLAGFYQWAIIAGLTDLDPTTRIPRPRVKPGLPRPIPTADLWFAMQQASGATLAMLRLGAFAGFRCCEIAGLDGPDVLDSHDPPVLVVAAGKGGKQRVVPANPLVIEGLRSVGIPHRGPVFTRPNGARLEAWKVSAILRAHLHACGVNASAHQLRHWFATNVLDQSGGDLRLTQELLGHSSPATTAIYTAWSQRKGAAVVSALDAAHEAA